MTWDSLFDGWAGPLRVAVVGAMAYVALIVFLRVSGKRTLSKMNAFDLVVTVALGSTLATVLLDKSLALADGLTAFAILILAQYAITFLSVRSTFVRDLVKSAPRTVMKDGELCRDTMRRERLTPDEIEAAIREAGQSSPARGLQVVLETDGSLSVVRSNLPNEGSPT